MMALLNPALRPEWLDVQESFVKFFRVERRELGPTVILLSPESQVKMAKHPLNTHPVDNCGSGREEEVMTSHAPPHPW
jgi:hypothetical protein